MTPERAKKLHRAILKAGAIDVASILTLAKLRGDDAYIEQAEKIEGWILRTAEKVADILWPLAYADDLAKPEWEVFE